MEDDHEFCSDIRGTTSRNELGQLELKEEGSMQCSKCILFSTACLLLSQGLQTETSGESREVWQAKHGSRIYCPFKKFQLVFFFFKWKWKSSNSLWPHVIYSPWDSLGQNTGVGSLSLLQGIVPTQGSNPVLSHCRWILYQLSHKGSPIFLK